MTYTQKMKRMLGEAKTHGKTHVTVEFKRVHYELIADVLKSCEPSRDGDGTAHRAWSDIIEAFTKRFKKLDKHFCGGFNAERFQKACGL